MKDDIHPPYQEVLFIDTSTGYSFVCGSALKPKERAVFEGKEYPVYNLHISSASHPFFTGSDQIVDTERRVDKFKKRYAKAALPKPKEEELVEPAQPKAKAKAKPKKKK